MPALRILLALALVAVSLTEVSENFLFYQMMTEMISSHLFCDIIGTYKCPYPKRECTHISKTIFVKIGDLHIFVWYSILYFSSV